MQSGELLLANCIFFRLHSGHPDFPGELALRDPGKGEHFPGSLMASMFVIVVYCAKIFQEVQTRIYGTVRKNVQAPLIYFARWTFAIVLSKFGPPHSMVYI